MSKKFEQALALHCSPALCGIKASNLISLSIGDFDIEKEVEDLNKKYGPKVNFRILRRLDDKYLLLIYRTKILENKIFEPETLDFLVREGYPEIKDLNLLLKYLEMRIKNNLEFPHEIGIFLGYDLSDTYHFIRKDKKCLHTGYWKVYSNVTMKQEIFNKYTRCRNCVMKLINRGYSIENFMR